MIIIQEKQFENVVCKMALISSLPQCVSQWWPFVLVYSQANGRVKEALEENTLKWI